MIFLDDNSSHSTRQQKPTITIFGNPYLESINPRILQQPQPEFIFPEGASKHRGRFEFAFSEIGSAVIVSLLLLVHQHSILVYLRNGSVWVN